MFYWIAVDRYYQVYTKGGFENRIDCVCSMNHIIDYCDVAIVNCIVKEV